MLSWIDIVRPSVNLLDPDTGRSAEMLLPAKVGSASPLADGAFLVALETGLWRLGSDGTLEASPSPVMHGVHFNDGKCDAEGRFWVGMRSSDGTSGNGAVYRRDLDGSIHWIDGGFDVPNGLGWSPDGKLFYIIDTVPRVIYCYDFEPLTGGLSGRRVLRRFDGSRGKPDGLAVDLQGNLWCAMWDGGGIQVLSPNGDDKAWLDTGCPRPTSCAFGGTMYDILFVTTASYGLDPSSKLFGHSGSILAYRIPTDGMQQR